MFGVVPEKHYPSRAFIAECPLPTRFALNNREGAKWRRAFAHGAELDFRGAALIPRKSSCGVRSTLRHLAPYRHGSGSKRGVWGRRSEYGS